MGFNSVYKVLIKKFCSVLQRAPNTRCHVTGCGNTLYLDISFRRHLRISSNKQTISTMRETFKSHNQTTGADIKTVAVTCVFL